MGDYQMGQQTIISGNIKIFHVYNFLEYLPSFVYWMPLVLSGLVDLAFIWLFEFGFKSLFLRELYLFILPTANYYNLEQMLEGLIYNPNLGICCFI